VSSICGFAILGLPRITEPLVSFRGDGSAEEAASALMILVRVRLDFQSATGQRSGLDVLAINRILTATLSSLAALAPLPHCEMSVITR